jgi:hypothetical protein
MAIAAVPVMRVSSRKYKPNKEMWPRWLFAVGAPFVRALIAFRLRCPRARAGAGPDGTSVDFVDNAGVFRAHSR